MFTFVGKSPGLTCAFGMDDICYHINKRHKVWSILIRLIHASQTRKLSIFLNIISATDWFMLLSYEGYGILYVIIKNMCQENLMCCLFYKHGIFTFRTVRAEAGHNISDMLVSCTFNGRLCDSR